MHLTLTNLLISLLVGQAGSFSPQDESAIADPPAAAGAMAPNLLAVGHEALLCWFEPAAGMPASDEEPAHRAYRLRMARYDGDRWSSPQTIAERSDFFVNWADVPSLGRARDGTLLAHWPQESGGATYAYDIMLARSSDGGTTWQTLGALHDDRTATEHGFVSMIPESVGIRAFWLDGREMEPGGHGSGTMTLRTAMVGEEIGPGAILDDRVCECCGTSAAVTDAGPVIVYRDRSDAEVRDIFIVRRVDGAWTTPRPVASDEWRIAACPVNGPAIAARGSTVAVAWYTRAREQGAVRVAFSDDSGARFGAPVTIDDTGPVGRVDLLLDDDGSALVSWLDVGKTGGALMIRRVTPAGAMGEPRAIAPMSPTRSSGFARLARLGSTLLIVWTEDLGERRLRARRIPVAEIDRPALEDR